MLFALLVGGGAMEPSGTVLQFLHGFAQLSSNEIGLKAETRKMYHVSIKYQWSHPLTKVQRLPSADGAN